MHALQFSIPILDRPTDHIYSAQFIGPGLGWLVLDYRGRKVVRHGGSWGAPVTMIPEENLGVVVLYNIDIEGLAGMLSYDLLDAYLVGPQARLGPEQVAIHLAQATKAPAIPTAPATRRKPSSTSIASPAPAHCDRLKTTPEPTDRHFTATWSSSIRRPATARLRRLQNAVDPLAPRVVLRPCPHPHHLRLAAHIFSAAGNRISTLTVKHVGWDNDEPDHLFPRRHEPHFNPWTAVVPHRLLALFASAATMPAKPGASQSPPPSRRPRKIPVDPRHPDQHFVPAAVPLHAAIGFADYPLPAFAPWCGAVLMLLALWLFWRSHADLGQNWSVTLEVRKGHQLVTHGVYRRIRHPMYAAIFLFCLAQGLLLPNWLAGWSALVPFALMYLLRIRREEQMMLQFFGEEYRDYMGRTWRLLPRLV